MSSQIPQCPRGDYESRALDCLGSYSLTCCYMSDPLSSFLFRTLSLRSIYASVGSVMHGAVVRIFQYGV